MPSESSKFMKPMPSGQFSKRGKSHSEARLPEEGLTARARARKPKACMQNTAHTTSLSATNIGVTWARAIRK